MTTRLRVPALTSENLRVRIRVDDDATNPTSWAAEAAWTAADADPTAPDWAAVSWEVGGPPYRLLVPTGSKAAGTYRLWVRVTAASETPVRMVGLVDFE